ncbi:MAG: hypothetical protein J0H67_16075 [Rhodospirillales bacterium]|nr:hypothetical protein [Rhodospirillales bacterium]
MRSLFGWIGCVGLYLLLAGDVSGSECAIAALLATLVVAFAHVLTHAADRTLGPLRPHDLLAPLATALAQLPADLGAVASVLARALRRRPAGAVGSVRTVPFRAPHTGSAIGLETLARSLAPRDIALQPQDDVLHLHTLGGRGA